jgi:alpha-ketoglutarate-dependent taurine dioxygenase
MSCIVAGKAATAPPALASSPFILENAEAWRRWRERKLAGYPRSATELVVEVRDPRDLSGAEHAALLDRLRRANMVVYASRATGADTAIPRLLGQRFGLHSLDGNYLSGEDSISRIEVSAAAEAEGFIPYTDRAIRWHTDGYYNPPARRIRAMVLHCVESAEEGGANALLDHELAFLYLRDADPECVRALMQPDAMTIPARMDDGGVARADETGPVFHVDAATGDLHMRFTARTRSIRWKPDAATQAAVALLAKILASDASQVHRLRLEPGMGILANNVLHERAAFTDTGERRRLLLRGRFFERIRGTESSFLDPLFQSFPGATP